MRDISARFGIVCQEFYIFYFLVFFYDPEINYIQGISGRLEGYVNTAKVA